MDNPNTSPERITQPGPGPEVPRAISVRVGEIDQGVSIMEAAVEQI